MMKLILNFIFLLSAFVAFADNPVVPGYFADPTIKKFGDYYYLYATTDGIKLASGKPQVWISSDLVQWYNKELEIEMPDGLTNTWAPDIIQGENGNYYYIIGNCERGCNIYGFEGESPIGPFYPLNNGQPLIPAGTSGKGLPALDAQFFQDPHGTTYAYYGTWVHLFGGFGMSKFNNNNILDTLSTAKISMEEVPKAFEAPFMFYRNGIYFLMYSAGDCRLSSYAVHYSYSKSPDGPFIPGQNNPILSTNEDGSIDGPGHNSVIEVDGTYYIAYHRHDRPRSTNGEFRQVCFDKIEFENDSTIRKIIPTDAGMPISVNQPENVAKNANVTASSAYHLVHEKTRYSNGDYDYVFKPENAVDDDNSTLWKAAESSFPQELTIDLGEVKRISQVMTEFEYPTYYYQYRIDVSKDGKKWMNYIDRSDNLLAGSPMIDYGNEKGRYVRLTILNTEKNGLFPAVWNLKVYSEAFEVPEIQNHPHEKIELNERTKIGHLLSLDLSELSEGVIENPIPNKGKLSGNFILKGKTELKNYGGRSAISFEGNNYLEFSKIAPKSLDWNGTFTVSVDVCNPEVGFGECLFSWNSRMLMLQSSYAALMYGTSNYGAMAHGDGAVDLPYKSIPEQDVWHNITVTFDGQVEKVFVDGKLNTSQPMYLYVKADKIRIGTSGVHNENFTGYMSGLEFFDKALTEKELEELFNK